MAMIIASLGLLVGLIAIWMATNAIKNTTAQGDLLLHRIRKEQWESIDKVEEKIKNLETANLKINESLKKLPEQKES